MGYSCEALPPHWRIDGQSAHFPEIESKVSVLHVLVVVLYTLMLLADHLIAFLFHPLLTVCHFYQILRRRSTADVAKERKLSAASPTSRVAREALK